MKLLSIENDPKTSKSIKYGYRTGVMYLAPYTLSGHNVCPMANKARCIDICLNTAGRGRFEKVQNARVNRTKLYYDDRPAFMIKLEKEISSLVKTCGRDGLKPAVRLNGTSDLRWENTGIMGKFPDIQFYDYTKIPNRKNLPDNYHLTFSYSLAQPKNKPKEYNWAVVFKGEQPKTYLGRDVIDGDEHDLRFLDPDNVVVGLKAKGNARTIITPFVVNTN